MRYAFQLRKIVIEVSGNQKLGPTRSSPDGLINVLYVQGADGVNIAPHEISLPPPHHQLKADDVQAIEAKLFDSEVFRLAVKIAMPPQRALYASAIIT